MLISGRMRLTVVILMILGHLHPSASPLRLSSSSSNLSRQGLQAHDRPQPTSPTETATLDLFPRTRQRACQMPTNDYLQALVRDWLADFMMLPGIWSPVAIYELVYVLSRSSLYTSMSSNDQAFLLPHRLALIHWGQSFIRAYLRRMMIILATHFDGTLQRRRDVARSLRGLVRAFTFPPVQSLPSTLGAMESSSDDNSSEESSAEDSSEEDGYEGSQDDSEEEDDEMPRLEEIEYEIDYDTSRESRGVMERTARLPFGLDETPIETLQRWERERVSTNAMMSSSASPMSPWLGQMPTDIAKFWTCSRLHRMYPDEPYAIICWGCLLWEKAAELVPVPTGYWKTEE